jgi:hypothetical protein
MWENPYLCVWGWESFGTRFGGEEVLNFAVKQLKSFSDK